MLANRELIKQNFNCTKHGEYTAKIPRMAKGVCPNCEKEKHNKVEHDKLLQALVHIGIRKRFLHASFDNYVATSEEQINSLLTVKRWFTNFEKGSNSNLCMVGRPGTGKTHLAVSIVKRAFKNMGIYPKYVSMPTVSQSIKDSYSNFNLNKSDILSGLENAKLLIIDEVGRQTASDHEWVFELVNERYLEMLPTVIISNLNKEGVKEHLGEASADRLFGHGASVVPFTWDSHRKEDN